MASAAKGKPKPELISSATHVISTILGIEDLCSKRDELHQQILQEEEEKQKIENDLRILTERLSQVNESIARKIATRNDYDKTIAETENAYKKARNNNYLLILK